MPLGEFFKTFQKKAISQGEGGRNDVKYIKMKNEKTLPLAATSLQRPPILGCKCGSYSSFNCVIRRLRQCGQSRHDTKINIKIKKENSTFSGSVKI